MEFKHQLMRKIKCCSCGRIFSNQESLKLILIGKIDCIGCHNTIVSVDNFNKKKIIIGSVFLLFFSFFLMNSGELSFLGFALILPLIILLHLFRATRKFSFEVFRNVVETRKINKLIYAIGLGLLLIMVYLPIIWWLKLLFGIIIFCLPIRDGWGISYLKRFRGTKKL